MESSGKACKTCGVMKGLGEYHCNRLARDGRSNTCKTCATARAKAWQANNKERVRARYLGDAYRARSREHYARNREARKAKDKAWRERNPEKFKASCRRWLAKQPGYNSNHVRLRRLREKRAMLSCLTWRDVRPFYALAAKLTKETGIEHHVDHIIPINSPVVCGLHVPANLQVIRGDENRRKRNRFSPDSAQTQLSQA